MYQIKFLKPVTLSKPSASTQNLRKTTKRTDFSYEITSTLTIANDLGEQFFYGSATLNCELRISESGDIKNLEKTFKPLARSQIEWTSGRRAIDVKMQIPSKYLQPGKYVSLHVSLDEESTVVDDINVADTTHEEMLDEWFDGWKTIIGSVSNSSSLASPKLQILATTSSLIRVPNLDSELPIKSEKGALRSVSDVLLFEELSGEIARHLWDAGIIVNNFTKTDFIDFTSIDPSRHLNILELGTGVGLVSIHLGKMLPKSDIFATDLPDAKEICELNISLNDVEDNVKFGELDWEGYKEPAESWDMIIVTDCTYNPTYYDALVNVLTRESNQDTVVILAHKFREPLSEPQFFVKIQKHFHLEKQILYNSQGHSITHIGKYRKL